MSTKSAKNNAATKSSNNMRRVGVGIYEYQSEERKHQGKSDVCYYIRFRKPGTKNIKKTEKIGWKSEGYSKQIATEIRAKRARDIRHDGKVKTSKEIQAEKREANRTVDEIAKVYFAEREGEIKGYKTDWNRYENHIKPVLGSRPVKTLTALDISRIKKAMTTNAPATVSNAIELLRRLINYGAKSKLCQKPDFTIQVPKKDNEIGRAHV